MILPTNIAELRSHIATQCQLGNPELACSAGNYTLANQQEAQRAFCDRLTNLFVRETHARENITPDQAEKIERKLQRKAQRFQDRHKIQRRTETAEKCGFVVIGLLVYGLMQFLFGKVLQALWDWYWKAKTAVRSSMACELAAAGEMADDDDEDD